MSVKNISSPMFDGRSTWTEYESRVPDTPNAVDVTADDLKRQVVCPAADPFMFEASYPSCVCRISNSPIRIKFDPSAYRKWCTGNHQICPVWQMARDRELAAKNGA